MYLLGLFPFYFLSPGIFSRYESNGVNQEN